MTLLTDSGSGYSKRIDAHRNVLAASSRYFDAMFSSKMAETFQTEVTIKGVEGKVLEALIDYCYTGQLCVEQDNAFEVLPAASLLQFDEIKVGVFYQLITSSLDIFQYRKLLELTFSKL